MTDANWKNNAPGSAQKDDPARGLDSPDHKKGIANPAHGTSKDMSDAARNEGEPELQEQPATESESHDPGADNPRVDR